MESEPIVAMSNAKQIKITTAIAPYASLYMRDDLIIIYRYVKIIRITNAYVNIKCSLYHRPVSYTHLDVYKRQDI